MTDPDSEGPSRTNLVIALLGGIAILLGLVWYFSGDRSSDQDKLRNPQIEQTAEADQAARCSAEATYGLIKQELVRRAAEARGADQAEFGQLASAATLRVENPVLENEDKDSGALNCSGNIYLDLPAGAATSDGRHGLMADVDYTIEAGGNVSLRNADSIIGPLATLTRVEVPPPAEGDLNAVAPEAEGNAAAAVSANVQPGPASSSPGRPSFDCARAQSPGEIAVCSDSGLAALDLNMATQYRRALTTASPMQMRLLQTTRDRFLAYRDRCPNRQCIANAYLGRMREIRDIAEGRLSPTR
ncbi:MAG TPA: hypothetical protein VF067_07955 [Sphingomicrobium sp.]